MEKDWSHFLRDLAVTSRTHRPTAAWWCLAASFVGTGAGFSMVVLTASLFIEPVQAEFGVTRTQAAIIPIVGMIALPVPVIVGLVTDRVGARKVAIAGYLALAVILVLLTQVTVGTLGFLALLFALAIAGPMASATVFTKPVAMWFADRPGMAFSITMTGVSVIGALAIPLVGATIEREGWRSGYTLLALIIVLVGLPIIVRWLREPSAARNRAQRPSVVTLRPIFADVRLWILIIALLSASIPIGGFMGHMHPLFLSVGMDLDQAAKIGSLFALMLGAGRLCAGFLLDRLPAGAVACACLLLAAAGAALFSNLEIGGSAWMVCLAASLIAFAYGAEADFIGYFCLRLFGEANYSALFGLASTCVMAGISFGGFMFALAFDSYANYALASMASAVLFVLSGGSFLLLRVEQGEAATA